MGNIKNSVAKTKLYFRLQIIFLAINRIPVTYIPYDSDDESNEYYVNTGLLDDIIANSGLVDNWLQFIDDYKNRKDINENEKKVYEAKIDFIG